jgi:hypothetical protein
MNSQPLKPVRSEIFTHLSSIFRYITFLQNPKSTDGMPLVGVFRTPATGLVPIIPQRNDSAMAALTWTLFRLI